MICNNCKSPIKENARECEWCNFIVQKSENISSEVNKTLLNKGECIFFSKRVTKTMCFYELYNDGIKIFDLDERLNIFIPINSIYNIEFCNQLKILHYTIVGFRPIFFIFLFFKYRRGFDIITSKSGLNTLIIKNSNYRHFKEVVTNYLK